MIKPASISTFLSISAEILFKGFIGFGLMGQNKS
jgi:hypothetical protein